MAREYPWYVINDFLEESIWDNEESNSFRYSVVNFIEIKSISFKPPSSTEWESCLLFVLVRALRRSQRGNPEPARIVNGLGLKSRVEQLRA